MSRRTTETSASRAFGVASEVVEQLVSKTLRQPDIDPFRSRPHTVI